MQAKAMADLYFIHLQRDFLSKANCFFCDRTVKFGRKRKHDVLEVKIIGIKKTILKLCQE